MTTSSEAPRVLQIGALPRRQAEGGVEIMLVSSRKAKQWIIPKGWPIPERSDSAVAAIRALEEAGLLGVVSCRSVGRFYHQKRTARVNSLIEVLVYPIRVLRQRNRWREKKRRVTHWFSPASAMEKVSNPELRKLISEFASRASPEPTRQAEDQQ